MTNQAQQHIAEQQLRDAAQAAYEVGVGPAEIVAQVLTVVRVKVRRAGGQGALERLLERVEEDVAAAYRIEQSNALRQPRDPRYDTEG